MRRRFAAVLMVVLGIPAIVSVAVGEQAASKTKAARAAVEAPPDVKKDWLSKSIEDILVGPEDLLHPGKGAPGYSPNK